MPLPDKERALDSPWPPKNWQPLQDDLDEASVWYGGDPNELAKLYVNRQSTRPSERRFFSWGRARNDTSSGRPKQLHVPAAGDVAATSADLLFGEEPTVRIPEAHEANATTEAKQAEDRLVEIADRNQLSSQLLEAAEVCAGIGGVYLRPVWDQEFADFPILDVVHADHAVPEFKWGRLEAVTFWRVVQTEGNIVIRLLERHEPGRILNGLYIGTRDKLGSPTNLDAHESSKGMQEDITLPAGVDGLVCRYVPNVLPNRRHRGWPVGRADTAGTETLMDALDETWTSWMRDIRLGKMRIVADRQAFQSGSRGDGAWLDTDREVFTLLDMGPTSLDAGAHPITPIKFELRTQQHAETCSALLVQIVTSSGYSGQTFGMGVDGQAESGTALRVKEGRSLRTKSRKQRYFDQAVCDTGLNMLVIDREIFGSKITPMRPQISFADSIINDPSETGRVAQLLAGARAASIETLVRMVNPEWDEDQVQAEVKRIKDEEGLLVPDPTGGLP